MFVFSVSVGVGHTHRLAEGELIDVSSEHGAGGEDGGVCGGHDGGGHGPEPEEGHPGRAQVLQHDGQDHVRLVPVLRRDGSVRRLVPVCGAKT